MLCNHYNQQNLQIAYIDISSAWSKNWLWGPWFTPTWSIDRRYTRG